MANYLTFSQIKSKVMRTIRDYNESMETMVEDAINMVYLNEVMVADSLRPLYWMVDFDDSIKSSAPSTITAISKANPGVITVASDHGLQVGDLVTLHNIEGMTELNDRIFQVDTVPTSTTFSTGVNTASYTAYSSEGIVNHRGVTLQTSGKSVQRVLYASWHDECQMSPIGPEEIEATNAYHWTDDTSGPPKRFYYGKSYANSGTELDQLIWHSGADAVYNLRYWFEVRANVLTNASDVPILPYQFHNMIVAGTIARLAEFNEMVDSPKIWSGLYSAQMIALKDYNERYWDNVEYTQNKVPYLL